MIKREHHYDVHLVWDGDRGTGTSSYAAYGREHRATIAGKPTLELSADATFRGDPQRLNPEDLFVSALSSCHMLSYLALCALEHLTVVSYEDAAQGTMREDGNGGGRFEEVVLRPRVVIADEAFRARALELHDRAHEICFIASSCSVPVRHSPTIVIAEEAEA